MRDMSAASSSDVDRYSVLGEGDGCSVSSLLAAAVGHLNSSSCEDLQIGGVVGIGMVAAVSWRSEKSVGRRPRGREGGQRRRRLGVEGGMFSWSLEGLELLSSERERRRFREGRGGVCGCGIFLVAHCCCRDCFLEWALASAIGLASWG